MARSVEKVESFGSIAHVVEKFVHGNAGVALSFAGFEAIGEALVADLHGDFQRGRTSGVARGWSSSGRRAGVVFLDRFVREDVAGLVEHPKGVNRREVRVADLLDVL